MVPAISNATVKAQQASRTGAWPFTDALKVLLQLGQQLEIPAEQEPATEHKSPSKKPDIKEEEHQKPDSADQTASVIPVPITASVSAADTPEARLSSEPAILGNTDQCPSGLVPNDGKSPTPESREQVTSNGGTRANPKEATTDANVVAAGSVNNERGEGKDVEQPVVWVSSVDAEPGSVVSGEVTTNAAPPSLLVGAAARQSSTLPMLGTKPDAPNEAEKSAKHPTDPADANPKPVPAVSTGVLAKLQFSVRDPKSTKEDSLPAKVRPESPREPAPDTLEVGPGSRHDSESKQTETATIQALDSAPANSEKPAKSEIPVVAQPSLISNAPATEAGRFPVGAEMPVHISTSNDAIASGSKQTPDPILHTREILPSAVNEFRAEPGAMHLVSRLDHQELRFGWNNQDFGRIEVRTTLSHDRVDATVSVPNAQLRDSLRAELGSLDRALASHSLELSQFSTFDNSSSPDNHRETQPQEQTIPGWKVKDENSAPSLRARTGVRDQTGLLDLHA